MAVSVVLNLTDKVSVEHVKQFLSFIPEGFDSTEDLRTYNRDRLDVSPLLLQIILPLPTQQEQGQGTKPLDLKATT